uniref:Putative kunitz-type protease inhibitor n=1 Tax=Amblyomma cajennense TaxID=34607 RepID=A0A023FU19_AMBCJ
MHSFLRLLISVEVVIIPTGYGATDECDSGWKEWKTLTKGYYYNKTEHRCVLRNEIGVFEHKVFPTEELCDWNCRANTDCLESMDAGQRCGSPQLMYYYDKETCQCTLFLYKGCGGNGNIFATLRECMVTCKGRGCISPPRDSDICTEKYITYYYNTRTGKCEERKYGCHRDGANFKTQKDCFRSCLLRSPTSTQS